jgi:pimeloyl-ACP methyl ester carboxylesterase
MSADEDSSTPGWFSRALAEQPEHCDIIVDGCRIHFRCWGRPNHPLLVLIHGGGAHSGWWDHIAPFLAQDFRVVAPDLSGHGDSGPRRAYDMSLWAKEVLTAAAAAHGPGQPTIVGHSMGGWVAAAAGQHFREDVDSIIVIDSPVRERAPGRSRLRNRRQPVNGYRTRDDILSRFTAVPSQETTLPYVMRHIALESVRQTSTGWIWKFDQRVFATPLLDPGTQDDTELQRILDEMACRVAYLRSEFGLVPSHMADRFRTILQRRGLYVELAAAGHHPMLDRPLSLIASLRTVLASWS